MQDSEYRPQRRSALVARELARLDIDSTALSEIRFAEQGSLTEDGAGYIPSSALGKTRTSAFLSGAGVMIKTSIARKLQNLPIGHSVLIMPL